MKKIAAFIAILLAAALGFGQTPDTELDKYKSGIQNFADDLAIILPMNSTIGLNWNDAYIGQLIDIPPRFAIGVTTGFTTLPYGSIKTLLEDMGVEADDTVPSFIQSYGVPLPAAVIDARVGGFILPFDMGFKLGYFKMNGEDLNINYILVGGDVRYRVLEQRILIPKISVGVGYNYMSTRIKMADALGDDISIGIPTEYALLHPALGGISTIDLSSPDLDLDMSTKVLDFKVQASWKALIFEPSLGFGLSYGMSSVSTQAESKLQKNGTTDLDQTELAALSALGFDVSDSSLGYSRNTSAFVPRFFCGLGFNLAVFRLDFGTMYGLTTRSWGATVNASFQL